MTIYEVMENFLVELFPLDVYNEYINIIQLTAFIMTYILVFSIIIIPLYKMATFFLKVGKK